MLLEVGHRMSPLVERYVEHEPQAASLFLAIARYELTPEELLEVRHFVVRRFSRRPEDEARSQQRLAPLLDVNTVVLGVRCDDLDDAYELGCARLADALSAPSAAQVATAVRARAEAIRPGVGDGVAVVSIALPGARPRAALVALESPVSDDVSDGIPISAIVLLAGPRSGHDGLLRVAHVARLASRGLAAALAGVRRADEAIERVEALELIG
jgi:PTS system nitrogen regulatory IIA component